MANWYPSRRILGFPAWFWVVLPILLLLGNLLITKYDLTAPDWDLRLPSGLAEPSDRSEVLREALFVVRNGESFRFVPLSDRKRGTPFWRVWTVMCQTDEYFSRGENYLTAAVVRREVHWSYDLEARRIDGGDGDKENPSELPPEQIRQLKPLVVAELNRRNPPDKLGDRLVKMLDNGLEASSTSFSPQNGLILLSWITAPIALVALGSMFVRPRAVSLPRGALPMSETEVLLIKIAAVRKRLKKRYKAAC